MPRELSKKQTSWLKAQAHPLGPRVKLGKEGVTDGFRQELDRALDQQELVKVAVAKHVEADLEGLAAELDANLVQRVGRMVVLYRPAPEPKLELPPA